jgi:hypothetical protein
MPGKLDQPTSTDNPPEQADQLQPAEIPFWERPEDDLPAAPLRAARSRPIRGKVGPVKRIANYGTPTKPTKPKGQKKNHIKRGPIKKF